MKEIKESNLEKSYESGIIDKEEYEKNKENIKKMKEPEKKEEKKETKEESLKSDKTLIISIIVLISVIVAIFLGFRTYNESLPTTIDELHEWNLKGKLKNDQGYMYNGVSFIKFEDLWYTQLASPGGSRLYNIQFRYGPQELEDVDIKGKIDLELFNDAKNYYVTFNPIGKDFSHVALAASDYNQQMINVFFKEPVAACDRNETLSCVDRPIITCDNTEDLTLYINESEEFSIEFKDNCILVQGTGFDLVKAVDRLLLFFYNVME
ncbi:hypothetical protein ISS07_05150 [Candidatus Woesearchaeota archaeon]|nr:hypothetical protein [Candidatus Woesearchaeota archaeon]